MLRVVHISFKRPNILALHSRNRHISKPKSTFNLSGKRESLFSPSKTDWLSLLTTSAQLATDTISSICLALSDLPAIELISTSLSPLVSVAKVCKKSPGDAETKYSSVERENGRISRFPVCQAYTVSRAFNVTLARHHCLHAAFRKIAQLVFSGDRSE